MEIKPKTEAMNKTELTKIERPSRFREKRHEHGQRETERLRSSSGLPRRNIPISIQSAKYQASNLFHTFHTSKGSIDHGSDEQQKNTGNKREKEGGVGAKEATDC